MGAPNGSLKGLNTKKKYAFNQNNLNANLYVKFDVTLKKSILGTLRDKWLGLALTFQTLY